MLVCTNNSFIKEKNEKNNPYVWGAVTATITNFPFCETNFVTCLTKVTFHFIKLSCAL